MVVCLFDLCLDTGRMLATRLYEANTSPKMLKLAGQLISGGDGSVFVKPERYLLNQWDQLLCGYKGYLLCVERERESERARESNLDYQLILGSMYFLIVSLCKQF